MFFVERYIVIGGGCPLFCVAGIFLVGRVIAEICYDDGDLSGAWGCF